MAMVTTRACTYQTERRAAKKTAMKYDIKTNSLHTQHGTLFFLGKSPSRAWEWGKMSQPKFIILFIHTHRFHNFNANSKKRFKSVSLFFFERKRVHKHYTSAFYSFVHSNRDIHTHACIPTYTRKSMLFFFLPLHRTSVSHIYMYLLLGKYKSHTSFHHQQWQW